MDLSENQERSEGRDELSRIRPELPRRAVPVLYAVASLFWISLYLYLPILAPYVEHLGGTLSTVGIVISAYGLAQLLFRLPLGLISDRLGLRRPFLAFGLIASFFASLGFILITHPWLMAGARFLSGMASSSWVAFTVLFASYFPSFQTARSIGYILFLNGLAIMIATITGGYLAELYGWLAPFKASILMALLGILGLGLVHEKRIRKSSEQTTLQQLKRVIRCPGLVLATLIAALGQYVLFSTGFGFVTNYGVSIGASKAQLGILTMVGTLSTSVGSLLAGSVIAAKSSSRVSVSISNGIVALGTAIVPYVRTVPLLCLSQIVAGFGRGISYTVLMSLAIKDLRDEDKATAMGFFQSYSVGNVFGPAISGVVGNRWGYAGIFLSNGVVVAIAGLLGLGLREGADEEDPK